MEIQDKLKAHEVNRWNIVNTLHKQTLAEHLFNVAIIAEEICRHFYRTNQGHSALIVYALKHDLAEVILGDVPTPTKERMETEGYNYRGLEWNIMDDEFPGGMKKLSTETRLIIKTADRMEALWFIETYGIGRHAMAVIEDMQRKMMEYYGTLPKSLAETAMEVWAEMTAGEMTI